MSHELFFLPGLDWNHDPPNLSLPAGRISGVSLQQSVLHLTMFLSRVGLRFGKRVCNLQVIGTGLPMSTNLLSK
jgi:hypothetical protein